MTMLTTTWVAALAEATKNRQEADAKLQAAWEAYEADKISYGEFQDFRVAYQADSEMLSFCHYRIQDAFQSMMNSLCPGMGDTIMDTHADEFGWMGRLHRSEMIEFDFAPKAAALLDAMGWPLKQEEEEETPAAHWDYDPTSEWHRDNVRVLR